MKLYYAPASPFVRKVSIVAIETGLEKSIERIGTNPWQAEEALTSENPLSKIPTLITDDGLVLYDSCVICEYLDSLHSGEKIIPESGEARWQVLRLQALADGLLDSGILRLREKMRPEQEYSPDWDVMQKGAVERALNQLEQSISSWDKTALNLGSVTVAVALAWLDFRFPDEDWRLNRSKLSAWYELFSKRPSMLETVPQA